MVMFRFRPTSSLGKVTGWFWSTVLTAVSGRAGFASARKATPGNRIFLIGSAGTSRSHTLTEIYLALYAADPVGEGGIAILRSMPLNSCRLQDGPRKTRR
jgi:hypothetical protein